MFPVASTLIDVSIWLIVCFTIGAETKRLLLNFLLLFPGQKETLISHLGNGVDHTDSMIDMTAVKESNILISDQHILPAN